MDKKLEYTMLKEEIHELINIQNNYIIAMYTITISIIGFAIERSSEWLFLLPYVILFSFQRIISAKNEGMVRIAAYIVVFLEKGTGWESLYEKISTATTIKHNNRKVFSKLKNIVTGRISSLQLGIVCSIGCIVTNLKKHRFLISEINNVRLTDVFPSIIAFVLFLSFLEWCKNTLTTMNKRMIYIESLTLLKKEIKDNN